MISLEDVASSQMCDTWYQLLLDQFAESVYVSMKAFPFLFQTEWPWNLDDRHLTQGSDAVLT